MRFDLSSHHYLHTKFFSATAFVTDNKVPHMNFVLSIFSYVFFFSSIYSINNFSCLHVDQEQNKRLKRERKKGSCATSVTRNRILNTTLNFLHTYNVDMTTLHVIGN